MGCCQSSDAQQGIEIMNTETQENGKLGRINNNDQNNQLNGQEHNHDIRRYKTSNILNTSEQMNQAIIEEDLEEESVDLALPHKNSDRAKQFNIGKLDLAKIRDNETFEGPLLNRLEPSEHELSPIQGNNIQINDNFDQQFDNSFDRKSLNKWG